MIAFIEDPAILQSPVDGVDFEAATAPLWAALEEVRPFLWRRGETYPANAPGLHQLMDDGEVDFSMAFNPAEASAAIEAGRLPETVRSFIPEAGSIGNTHFVAIPFNAAHQAGAMVVADFLMSPDAQVRKQDPAGWGDWTVLDVAKLSDEDKARFDALPLGVATLSPAELTPVLPEPHPSWMTRIEKEWLRRFSS
jgi:putative thiamine transport system substrate-binding protein